MRDEEEMDEIDEARDPVERTAVGTRAGRPDDSERDACVHRFRVEVSTEALDLLDVLEAHADADFLQYIEQPERGEALLAIGCAHEIVTEGPSRTLDAARSARSVLARMVVDPVDRVVHTDPSTPRPGRGTSGIGPRFVGGFGFADAASDDPRWRAFSSCRLVLPEALWLVRDGVSYCIRSERCDCKAAARRPPSAVAAVLMPARSTSLAVERARWRGRVETVLADIAAGRVEKVVLSRSATFERAGLLGAPELAPHLLRELRRTRPSCFTFCVGASGARFVGSTPELLVRRRGDSVEAHALAGTERRSADEREDRSLACSLARSQKNLREQAAVTRAIVDVLRPRMSTLEVSPEPSLVGLPEAFHLHTAIYGRLASSPNAAPHDALELAGALHPTPAVCGTPRAVARELIERDEGERGWYTGAVGWIDGAGDGTFVVALRAALLEARRVTLWAGAGIVEGSDADAEFAETEIKMRAVRMALDELEASGRPSGNAVVRSPRRQESGA